jgi:hypothetical protein
VELHAVSAEDADAEDGGERRGTPPRRLRQGSIDDEDQPRDPRARGQEVGKVDLDHHAALVRVDEPGQQRGRDAHAEAAAEREHAERSERQVERDVSVQCEVRGEE